MMNRRPINYQLILSVSAIFLSFLGLLISGYQARLARENQHMSVWPHLRMDTRHIEQNFDLVIANDGVGPAIIREVSFQYAGLPTTDHISMLRNAERNMLADSLRTGGRFYVTLTADDVLKSGEERELYTVKNNRVLSDALAQMLRDSAVFQSRIIYSDVYTNCWQVLFQKSRNQTTPCQCP